MHEDSGFNFAEGVTRAPAEGEFRRQRQAYLAERNARKQEAQAQLRKARGSSSSSPDADPPAPVPALLPAPRLLKEQKEACNTDSSNSPSHREFKQERRRYQQERLARRQEAALNRRKEFGSSSSEEKDEVTIRPRHKPPQLKVKRVPFREEESSPFGFTSLELTPGLGSARDPRPSRGLLSSVRLKDKQWERRSARERFEVEVPSKKGVNVWL